MNDYARLRKRVEQQARRMKKAEQERSTVLSQTVFLGTLGLLFVLPVILCAYIGLWIDRHGENYSAIWTLVFLFVGVIIGALNVYLFIRSRE